MSKPAAGVGSTFALVGFAMLVSVMLSQNFVVVELAGTTGDFGATGAANCKDPNFLGTLGIFKSSFMPACAIDGGKKKEPYASLKPQENVDTTSFSPLFPAQTNFGGSFPLQKNFTTCEEFYAVGGSTDQTMASLAFLSIGAGLKGSTDSVTKSATDFKSFLPAIPLTASGLLGQKINITDIAIQLGAVPGSLGEAGVFAYLLADQYEKLTSIGQQLTCTNLPGGSTDNFASSSYGTCVKASTCAQSCVGFLNLFKGSDETERLTSFALGPYVAVRDAAFSDLGFQVIGYKKMNPAKTLQDSVVAVLSSTNDTEKAVFKGTGQVVVNLIQPAFKVFATSKYSDIVAPNLAFDGLVGLQLGLVKVEDFDFNKLKITLKGLVDLLKASMPVSDLSKTSQGNLTAAWAALASCENTIVKDCKLPNFRVVPPTDAIGVNEQVFPACVLLGADSVFRNVLPKSVTNVADCTFSATLDTLVNALPALGASIPSLANATAQDIKVYQDGLRGLFSECKKYKLNFNDCPTVIPSGDYLPGSGIPKNINLPYPLCVGLALKGIPKTCSAENNTFIDFLTLFRANDTAALLSSSLGKTTADGLKLLGASYLKCKTLSAVCVIQDSDAYAVLANGGYVVAQRPASASERVKECKDADTDIAAFKTAQSLVTAAAPFIALGGIVGLVALALNKGPVAFGAGALSLLGGILVLAALVVVKGAPVYQKLSLPKVDGQPVYLAYSGQLIAILGGVFAILGGIIQLVSGCLNKAGSGDALGTKVDATY